MLLQHFYFDMIKHPFCSPVSTSLLFFNNKVSEESKNKTTEKDTNKPAQVGIV